MNIVLFVIFMVFFVIMYRFIIYFIFPFKSLLFTNNGYNIKKGKNNFSICSFNLGLVSINIFGIIIFEPAKFVKQRFDSFLKQLYKKNIDILFLQEIYSEKFKKKLIQKLKNIYPYILYYKKTGKFDLSLQNGLMILSKFPITDHKFIPLKNTVTHEKLGLNKGFIYAKIQIGDKNITFVNGHNIARGLLKNERSKHIINKKSKQIQQILEYSKKNNIDFIIGDYNCGPCFFKNIYNLFYKKNYLEVSDIKCKKQKLITWDINNPLTNGTLFTNTPSQKDDHIFISKKNLSKYNIKDAKIIFNKKILDIKGKKYPVSDHYAVYSEIEIK